MTASSSAPPPIEPPYFGLNVITCVTVFVPAALNVNASPGSALPAANQYHTVPGPSVVIVPTILIFAGQAPVYLGIGCKVAAVTFAVGFALDPPPTLIFAWPPVAVDTPPTS